MLTFFHTDQLLHVPMNYFSRGKMRQPQELPVRAEHLLRAAVDMGFDVQAPPDAGTALLAKVHTPQYLHFLETAYDAWHDLPEDWGEEVMSNIFVREPNALRGILAQAGRYLADGSCPVGRDTWRASYWAAQCAIAGAQAVLDGANRAYALCRPPGHHARKEAAGGFCYLNNAAIAAEALRARYGKVAILDTDMHHGQGTQEIFYDRADVLYVSIHGDPVNFYPATAGHADETGSGAGAGYNLNLPMPHGSPEAVFFEKLDQALAAVRSFGAEVLVLSLGFDVYVEDPQAKVAVTTEGFGRLGGAIAGLQLPTLVVQEGGYHYDSLQQNARAFFGGLGA
ncbi:histone deacetylase family protein [Bordetella sp. 2513F-2]